MDMQQGSSSTNEIPFRRFLDKFGMTGGKLQLVNGIILITTFFGVRIIYGGYNVRKAMILHPTVQTKIVIGTTRA
jgi:hypothetical protein